MYFNLPPGRISQERRSPPAMDARVDTRQVTKSSSPSVAHHQAPIEAVRALTVAVERSTGSREEDFHRRSLLSLS